MPLKVITIDFWNTLFDSSNGTGRNNARQIALLNAIDKHGITVMGDEFSEAVQASWATFNDIWKEEQRTPSPREMLIFIWDFLKLPKDNESIEEVLIAFEQSILTSPPKIIEGVKNALEVLSQKYKLAIVSDTGFSPGSAMRTLMKKNEIFDYFSAFSFSNETGVSKPSPKAFFKVLDELQCLPQEALHIGDIERTDIAGAKDIGMKAILYTGDSTAFLNQGNPETSRADASANSWKQILTEIEQMN